jgi:hypothetical protein
VVGNIFCSHKISRRVALEGGEACTIPDVDDDEDMPTDA